MQEKTLYEYLLMLDALPEKEEKIYKAVEEFIKEGKDVSSLTISEISARAGIGKGTTYEYFESKEDLIYKAIHYLVFNSVKQILLITMEDKTFKEKFFRIMDYMWENKLEDHHVQSVLKFVRNSGSPIAKDFSDKFDDKRDPCAAFKIVDEMLANFINVGVEEGIITEPNPLYRKNALCSQLIMFLFIIQDGKEGKDKKEVEEYVYNGLITLLNMNK